MNFADLWNKQKIFFIVIFIAISILSQYGCSENPSDGDTGTNPDDISRISQNLFGANLDWKNLAGNIMRYGDLIRDRSFRSKADTVNTVQVWGEITTVAGSFEWNTLDDGDTNPAGGKRYKGYVQLSQPSPGFTGITQQLAVGVNSGDSFQLNFSSFGVGAGADIEIFLYNTSFSVVLASANETAIADAWKQHTVSLTATESGDPAILAIYITSASTVRLDEIRLAQSGASPTVKAHMKSAIRDLGVRALRWPGGTLTDSFYWTESIGSRISRGELEAYGYYETPALGLHEFLNLCEELNITPLIQINVLDTPESAADLIEYILGPDTSPQGAIRSSNGRPLPWDVTYFEIGNEPSTNYSSGVLPDSGSNYASVAERVLSAVKNKASALGKTIEAGVISEAGFQLAQWLIPGTNDVIDMLYNWNSQVFNDATGLNDEADFTHAHFYSSRYFSADPETDFHYLMSGGAVLAKTIDDILKPVTLLPVWLTEYHVVLEDNSGVIQTDYLKDFQSGLAIADILMHAINNDLKGAYLYNLIDLNGFGMIRDSNSNVLRPAGIIFGLFSVMAGEEKLNIIVDDDRQFVIITGAGNVPSNLSYSLITAIASKNSVNGKPRILLLNRSLDNDMDVSLGCDEFAPGDALLYRYENANLNANNETVDESVKLVEETYTFGDSFSITIPAHSLMRIDFQ